MHYLHVDLCFERVLWVLSLFSVWIGTLLFVDPLSVDLSLYSTHYSFGVLVFFFFFFNLKARLCVYLKLLGTNKIVMVLDIFEILKYFILMTQLQLSKATVLCSIKKQTKQTKKPKSKQKTQTKNQTKTKEKTNIHTKTQNNKTSKPSTCKFIQKQIMLSDKAKNSLRHVNKIPA